MISILRYILLVIALTCWGCDPGVTFLLRETRVKEYRLDTLSMHMRVGASSLIEGNFGLHLNLKSADQATVYLDSIVILYDGKPPIVRATAFSSGFWSRHEAVKDSLIVGPNDERTLVYNFDLNPQRGPETTDSLQIFATNFVRIGEQHVSLDTLTFVPQR